MNWTRIYRAALRLLPPALRHKHGAAMADLFARDLGQARARGWLYAAGAGLAAVGDVLWRSAYEHLRPNRAPAAASDHPPALRGSLLDAHDAPSSVARFEGPHMPIPTNRELLRRHAVSFLGAFVALTVLLVAHFGVREAEMFRSRGAPAGTLLPVLILALPFTAAMTIPMAVLISVLAEFTRLGANGTLDAARQMRDGVRRLVLPVLGAAAGVAVVALVLTAGIVPHANSRLSEVLSGRHEGAKSDRTMTMTELRAEERAWRAKAGAASQRRAAAFEVEFHKKLALPAACVALALVGIALALRFPRGGMWMVVLVSVAVWGLYYVMLITGETLAERLVVSPFLAMWGANLGMVVVAWLASVSQSGRPPSARRGSVAMGHY